jgi:hypothetical protein
MNAMSRLLLPLVIIAMLAGIGAAAGQGAKGGKGAKGVTHGPLSFKVKLVQEATYRHPHPPDGNAGDTFSTTLRLFAIGNVLGFPDKTPMGTMSFMWGPLNGSCSTAAASCSGTTNLATVTRLPGGTITAGGKNVSLSKGLVVPIQSGTGIFKGVKGRVYVAPAGEHVDVFKLIMP